jgi:hypothetical protein
MRVALVLVAMLAVMPALSARAQTSFMVGTWFGRGQPDDKLSMYIDRMRPDGRWRGEYRACLRGRPLDQVQTGRWTLDGDRLLLHVETVDGAPMPRTDVYRMLAHDGRGQKYLAQPSGFAYTPARVDDGFSMPPCDLIS